MTNDEREIELIRLDCAAARNDLALYQTSHGTVQSSYEAMQDGLGQFRLLNHDYRDYGSKS